jgi:hypothetical protein
LSLLEGALDQVDDLLAEHPLNSTELAIASNLRGLYLHHLLLWLTNVRNMDFNSWFKYIKLFSLRVEPEIGSILSRDPSLRDAYRKFLGLWRDELLIALQRASPARLV